MFTWNKTKIIATLGPASNTKKVLRSMIAAGLDIVRLNGAHSSPQELKNNISLTRDVSKGLNSIVAILLDLPGPKLRIGELKFEPLELRSGKMVTLICGQKKQVGSEIPVVFKGLAKDIKKGDKIYINDGIVSLKVLGIQGQKINCKVMAGGELRSRKGINLPNTKLNIPSLTKKDKELLKVAIKEKVDYVGLSFVRSAKDIIDLKNILSRKAPEIGVIAKIEKPEALKDIDSIIEASDAIMVARGDLGIEIHLEKIPSIQKELLKKCHLAGKPSITATQMLESMIDSSTPTRAEATDVANAIWEGSDAIMLSAETSVGKHPALAVKEMIKIAKEAEKHMTEFPDGYDQRDPAAYQAQVISRAAGLLSKDLKAKAIVTPTRSGKTALFVSKQRPKAEILAPTSYDKTARRMCLYWGVRPLKMGNFKNVDDMLKSAEKLALEFSFIKKGDTIIITSGAHAKKEDVTRLVEVRQV